MRLFSFFSNTSGNTSTGSSSSDDELLALESASDSDNESANKEPKRKQAKLDFPASPGEEKGEANKDKQSASVRSLSKLPDDLLALLVEYLPPRDLANFSAVAKFSRKIPTNHLWKRYVSELSELGINKKTLKTINGKYCEKLYAGLLKIPYSDRYWLKDWQLYCLTGDPEAIKHWKDERSLMASIHDISLNENSDDSSDSMELPEEEKGMDEKPTDQTPLNKLRDWKGANPLHMAALSGSITAVRCVEKEFGIPITSCDSLGRNLMHYAAWSGSRELMMYVNQRSGMNLFNLWTIANGTGSWRISTTAADIDGHTPSHYAALSGSVEAMKYAIEILKIPKDTVGAGGANIFLLAALSGSVKGMVYAIELGIPFDSVDNAGATAFHYAARSGSVEAMDEGIKLGIAADSLDNNNANALHYASEGGSPVAMDHAVKLGILADSKDVNGANAFLHAASGGSPTAMLHAVNVLKNDPFSADSTNASALHYASRGGSTVAMDCAVELGIPADSSDVNGANAFLHACWGGSPTTMLYAANLLETTDSVDSDNAGALHYAVLSNSILAIGLAIDGFDIRPWVMDANNQEPLHYAIEHLEENSNGYVYMFERRHNAPPHGEEAPIFNPNLTMTQ